MKGEKFSEVPEDYLRWAINEVETAETCHLQLRRLATWAKVELGGPPPGLSQAAPTPGNATSSSASVAPSTPQAVSPFLVPETMMDMMQMVDQLCARFGEEVMYMAWASQSQSNPAQMFNTQQQEEGMDWTDLTNSNADDQAL